ncbi:MAG: hypothetical protein KF752_03835 [Pirellulaceae bacterium]|nr:hypothetical protein [Pirellulaceae bacterium]
MNKMRKTVAMLPHEDKVLRDLYTQANIPSDQYPQRNEELESLVADWNSICCREEAPADLLHYMVTKRKNGQWVRLGRTSCERLKNVSEGLSEEELQTLDAIHEDLQIASDRFALDSELSKQLQTEFAKRTGRIYPPLLLAAAMIRRRKAGTLATLRPTRTDQDSAFADIDKVVGQ